MPGPIELDCRNATGASLGPGEKSNDHARFDAAAALDIEIIFLVVLMSWLALGVMVVALLNLAKMIVRSSARRNSAMGAGGRMLASVNGRDNPSTSFGSRPSRQPVPIALPPPQATRRSA